MADGAAVEQHVPQWPGLLRMRPMLVFGLAIAIFVAIWGIIVVVDVANVAGPYSAPAWTVLFDRSAVEVAQWTYLAATVVAAGYLAGRLAGTRYAGAGSFFFVISIGVALMLIEDAGDVRHKIGYAGEELFGSRILGQQHSLFTHAPSYALLAFFPLYALIRYGRHVWRAPSLRKYLLGAFAFYGVSQVMSLVSWVGDFYGHLGHAINDWLLFGRLSFDDAIWGRSAFSFVDAAVEESLELLGVGCLLAMVVAFVADLRAGRVGEVSTRPLGAAESGDAPRQTDGRSGRHDAALYRA